MNKGKIYHINFDGYKGSEINNIHLGIVFNIPKINNMVFCISLTSPKLKHFKTENDFNNRNYLNLKRYSLIYINQTDSIALLDQMGTISNKRLLNTYKDNEGYDVVLNNNNLNLINVKTIKYLENILNIN